jgi:hypothetical protein
MPDGIALERQRLSRRSGALSGRSHRAARATRRRNVDTVETSAEQGSALRLPTKRPHVLDALFAAGVVANRRTAAAGHAAFRALQVSTRRLDLCAALQTAAFPAGDAAAPVADSASRAAAQVWLSARRHHVRDALQPTPLRSAGEPTRLPDVSCKLSAMHRLSIGLWLVSIPAAFVLLACSTEDNGTPGPGAGAGAGAGVGGGGAGTSMAGGAGGTGGSVTPGPSQVLLPTGVVLDIPEVPDVNGDYDCAAANILCVPSEFATLQLAADAVVPDDTVVVSAGNYEGFVLTTTGTKTEPIRFVARPGTIIDAYSSSDHGIVLLSDFDNNYYVDHVYVVGFQVESPVARCIYTSKAIASRPSMGHLIANNTCLNSGTEGFVLSQISLSVVQDNVILNAGNGSPESARDHGIYFSNGGTGNTLVRRNIIVGSSTAGMHFNGDRFVDTGGTDGVISGMLMDGNVLAGNGQNGFNMDGVQDSLFINNVFYSNGNHSIRGYAIDGSEGPKNMVAINNTMIGDASAVKMTDSLGGHVVFNNLFVDMSDQEVVIPSADLSEASNLSSTAISFVTLPANLNGDPNEVPGYDFHVTAGQETQLVDQGQAQLAGQVAPDHDRSGALRGGLPDIGAIEY